MSFIITDVWAYCSIGPDGEEGVMASQMLIGGQLMFVPLVAADKTRIDCLLPHADAVKQMTGMDYKLKHFKLVE